MENKVGHKCFQEEGKSAIHTQPKFKFLPNTLYGQ